MEGDLGLGTLPWLLARLNHQQATGVLHILVDGVERRVFFKWGFVLFASSGPPGGPARPAPLERGTAFPPRRSRSAYEKQKATGKRFGECLVEMGAITEDALLAAVERQVREIITFLFSISRGHFRFEPADEPLDDDLMLDLPMQRILLDGIRSMIDPLALRIGVGPMTDVLHLESGRPATDEPPAERFRGVSPLPHRREVEGPRPPRNLASRRGGDAPKSRRAPLRRRREGELEPLLDEGEGRAHPHRLAPLGSSRPRASVPRHEVDVRPRDPRCDELLKKERRGDGAGEW